MQKQIKNQAGFSLLELMVVVVVIGILAAIAMLNTSKSQSLLSDKMDLMRLRQVVTAQLEFRQGFGTRSYATLQTLATKSTSQGKLLPETVVTFSGTTPQPVDGWLVQDNPLSPPTDTSLLSGFSVVMSKVGAIGSDDLFCVHEDGMLRKSTVSAGCTRTSEKIK